MRTALIIEDHPDNMVLMGRLLEKSGYLTLRAFSGMEGCELARHRRPDFIILDVRLPDIDGMEVVCKIRAELGRGIPIIAMTCNATARDRENLLGAGCDCYIEKPIDTLRIISQIRAAVGETDETAAC